MVSLNTYYPYQCSKFRINKIPSFLMEEKKVHANNYIVVSPMQRRKDTNLSAN
jgi:hypothetical protein